MIGWRRRTGRGGRFRICLRCQARANSWCWAIVKSCAIFSAFLVLSTSGLHAGKSKKEWETILSRYNFIGTDGQRRAAVEKKLRAKILGEVDYDHGFALLRNVYYELDENWVAVLAYRGPSGNSSPNGIPQKMELVITPRLIPNSPGLQERLRKHYTRASRLEIEKPE